MTRPLIFLLSFMLFFDGSIMSQLMKLPKLYDHFVEHKSLDKHVGVIEFITMHYMGKDIQDNDHEKDMGLPFKTSNYQPIFQLAIESQNIATEKFKFSSIQNHWPDTTHFGLMQSSLSSLFRPPRNA
jgi:hypothetical protein